MSIEDRLKELDIRLPEPPKALATYVPYVVTGNLVSISGQVPLAGGAPMITGTVGDDITLEQARDAAQQCAVQIIALLKDACDGDLNRVRRIVRLGGFVSSTPGFTDHPKVINGASDLMVQVFGEEIGRHSRAAVGVAALPLGVPVEVDALAEIRS